MQPRDIFDVLLFVATSIALYFQVYGPTLSPRGLTAILNALQSIDVVYYLVVAGVLAVCFVGYMTIYVPQKQSSKPSK
jgi:uncharacterized membrane protein YraQ (UPF0718 family)